ncbi:MAG: FHA domain-containing protein, partial [Kiritimatiellaeota bacterium]|nr:FHA domain-containing protein [Kiritimatiellota bacterium]
MFSLDIVNPGQASRRFELPDGKYVIGRGDTCQIRLRHPEISEVHATLTLQGGGATIQDMNSSNGITINGAPVPPKEKVPVRSDSVIAIGPCLLRVSQAEKEAPQTGGRTSPSAAAHEDVRPPSPTP